MKALNSGGTVRVRIRVRREMLRIKVRREMLRVKVSVEVSVAGIRVMRVTML